MTRIVSRPEYVNTGIKIYIEKGETALLEYLKNNIPKSTIKSESEELSFKLFCPSCGHSFLYSQINTGKVTGGIGGFATGAYLGAQIGIAGGPFGAIAGTIPGAILGGIFGKNIGNNFDKPICPNCKTTFEMPKNMKATREIIMTDFELLIRRKAEYIILLSKDPKEVEKTKTPYERNQELLKKVKEIQSKKNNEQNGK